MDRSLLNEAARRVQSNDPTSAGQLIASLLAAHPNDADVLTLQGLLAQRMSQLDVAAEIFARARAADPRNPARIGNHALALKALGHIDSAISALGEALAITPNAPATLNNIASCLIAGDREEEAEAPLRAALVANEAYPEAWNNLGIVLARTGRATHALNAYRSALRYRPAWVEAKLNLADALILAGDHDGAEGIVKEIVANQPRHARAANLLGALAETSGERGRAIRIYERTLAAQFNYPVAHNLTLALLTEGRAEEALATTRRMLEESPSLTTPLALRLAALEALGRYEECDALAAIERFVMIEDVVAAEGFPSLAEFHRALAAELRDHRSLTFEPEGLVTRGGRQSDDLAREGTPALAALASLAHSALAKRHAELNNIGHPWLLARPDRWSLTLWGTILAPGGEVQPHIHAPNWLSGVYYPDVPNSLEANGEGGFAIGVLPEMLGRGRTLSVIAARPGRLILFPSYLWHATVPFGGSSDRISFAFDLVPATVGTRHRLPKKPGQRTEMRRPSRTAPDR